MGCCGAWWSCTGRARCGWTGPCLVLRLAGAGRTRAPPGVAAQTCPWGGKGVIRSLKQAWRADAGSLPKATTRRGSARCSATCRCGSDAGWPGRARVTGGSRRASPRSMSARGRQGPPRFRGAGWGTPGCEPGFRNRRPKRISASSPYRALQQGPSPQKLGHDAWNRLLESRGLKPSEAAAGNVPSGRARRYRQPEPTRAPKALTVKRCWHLNRYTTGPVS